MRFQLLPAVLFLLNPLWVFSQSYIGAELRSRIIFDNGYTRPLATEANPMVYVTQRTRINALYDQDKLQSYVSFQDTRFWGGDNLYKESGTSGNNQSLSLHQGWVKLKPAPSVSITAGRQQFVYDDLRILSARNWNDAQVTYDALLFRFDDTLNRIDLALSWNTESTSTALFPKKKFRVFDFLRYERSLDPVTVSVIALLTGNTTSDTTEDLSLRSTFGLNLTAKIRDLDARATLYHQHHLNRNGSKVNAYCLSVLVSQPFLDGRARLGTGFDFLSGQDETNPDAAYQNCNHRFDVFYGTRHAFYGYMDYFSNLPEQGLQDLFLKTEYRPRKGISIQGDYHYFLLAAGRYDVVDPARVLPKRLGHEIDLTIGWDIWKSVNLKAGYSFMLRTTTLEQVKGVYGEAIRFPQFAYLMLTVKPEIYKAVR